MICRRAPPQTGIGSQFPLSLRPKRRCQSQHKAPSTFNPRRHARPPALSIQRRRSTSAAPPAATAAAQDPTTSPPPPRSPLSSLLSLLAALACLIAAPAKLFGGSPTLAATALLPYFLFFAIGSVRRVSKYGRLAPRATDAQAATPARRAALAAFIAAMPAFHWGAWWEAAAWEAASYYSPPFQAPVVKIAAAAVMTGAIILNAAAAAALGPAYDRLVAPKELVTTGPYRFVQHPVYSSYMALFLGYAALLGAPVAGAATAAVCLIYYSTRVAVERQVLQEAFGAEYDAYERSRGAFLPRIW